MSDRKTVKKPTTFEDYARLFDQLSARLEKPWEAERDTSTVEGDVVILRNCRQAFLQCFKLRGDRWIVVSMPRITAATNVGAT